MFPPGHFDQPSRRTIYSSRLVGPPAPSHYYPDPRPPDSVQQQPTNLQGELNYYRQWPVQHPYGHPYTYSTSQPATSRATNPTAPSSIQLVKRQPSIFSALLPPYHRQRPKILFYHKDQPYYEFTNFAPYSVQYDRKVYPTSEHLFQSLKVRFFRTVQLSTISYFSLYVVQG